MESRKHHMFRKGLDWAIPSSLKLGFSQAEPEARIQIQVDYNTIDGKK